MHIEKLSLYVITFNEEKRLARTLESVQGLVDEIIVVDSGSTDRTKEIAESFGARFLYHEWESDAPQCRWAEEQCTYRWVLRLDADEVVSPALYDELLEIRRSGTKDAYILKIGDVFPGMKHANPFVKHYTRLKRLYCRDAWTMCSEMSHDEIIKIRPDATFGKCRNFIDHYSFYSIHQVVQKYDAESVRLVRRAIVQNKNYSPWRMFGASFAAFIKLYIFGRFFLLGWWGFIHCVNVGFLRFLKFAKYYEYYHNPNISREDYFPSGEPDSSEKN